MSIFDLIITRTQIAEAARSVLEEWLPAYIAEIERQNELVPEALPLPASFTSRTSFSQWTDEPTPAILIVSPGLVNPSQVSPGLLTTGQMNPGLYGEPESDGEGRWRAPWGLTVGVVVAGEDPGEIQEQADLYAAAIRACLLQRQPLPGVDGRLRWIGESYVGIPDEQALGVASARVGFECLIPVAVNDQAGPAPATAPPPNPYDPPEEWPIVETTHLTVDPLEDT
ncbi:MAG TPA: hypothetical protein VMF31_03305 [Solirubrobacterales bacterium]|nr:hypothetical protein [Solirubrobacterales bacterium]